MQPGQARAHSRLVGSRASVKVDRRAGTPNRFREAAGLRRGRGSRPALRACPRSPTRQLFAERLDFSPSEPIRARPRSASDSADARLCGGELSAGADRLERPSTRALLGWPRGQSRRRSRSTERAPNRVAPHRRGTGRCRGFGTSDQQTRPGSQSNALVRRQEALGRLPRAPRVGPRGFRRASAAARWSAAEAGDGPTSRLRLDPKSSLRVF